MDLNRILHFITITECGSYTKAGQKLGLPKSTLSKSLAALEESMQVRLLNRSTRKLSLTHAGKQFFNRSLPLITNLQNAHLEISELSEKIKGNLRVTMPYELGDVFICNILPEFMDNYPEISFEFDFSYENKDLIEEGFDLAIRVGELDDSSYIAKKLTSSSIGFYASPKYLQRYGEPKSLAELEQHKNILPINVGKFFQKDQKSVPNFTKSFVCSSNSLLFNKGLCIAGKGIAGLADVFCVEEVASGKLIKILSATAIINSNIHLVYPSRSHKSKALSVFSSFLLDKIKTFKTNNQ